MASSIFKFDNKRNDLLAKLLIFVKFIAICKYYIAAYLTNFSPYIKWLKKYYFINKLDKVLD